MKKAEEKDRKFIIAQMTDDWCLNYIGGHIPRVIGSNHPRFDVGTRLDWGFLQVALGEGFQVTIWPHVTPKEIG